MNKNATEDTAINFAPPHHNLRKVTNRIHIEFNPEETLEIWRCSNCGCDCAGDKKTGRCASCDNLTPKQRGEVC